MINDSGGVDGRKLNSLPMTTVNDPTKDRSMLQPLDGAESICPRFFVGTPTAVKYVPMAESNKIPLIGLFTGAQTLYTPLRHWESLTFAPPISM